MAFLWAIGASASAIIFGLMALFFAIDKTSTEQSLRQARDIITKMDVAHSQLPPPLTCPAPPKQECPECSVCEECSPCTEFPETPNGMCIRTLLRTAPRNFGIDIAFHFPNGGWRVLGRLTDFGVGDPSLGLLLDEGDWRYVWGLETRNPRWEMQRVQSGRERVAWTWTHEEAPSTTGIVVCTAPLRLGESLE